MPNETEKGSMPQKQPIMTTTQIHATQLPIDLASKVIVKPANDNTKMIQQPTFRTIQQPPQMRVVRMPTPAGASTQIIQQIMPQAILKTSMQQTGRSTITVSKAPATYLPRVTATLSTIQQTKGGQQIRTPTPPVSGTALSPAFVRTSITPRTSSPTAVLSQGTTAWVSGTGAMQVQVPTQLIRSTITQNRTHILQPNAVTVTNNSGNAQITNIFGQQTNQQQNIGGTTTTISVPTTQGGQQNQQPTYVATVLPQRPQATIVYTSQQQQPYIQGQVQRMGITNATANTRQVRPIQRIPTTGIRVNTSSLSIRQNVPGLTPTTVLTAQNRNAGGNLVGASTTISNTIPARIFQVATSQSGSQQVSIGQQNQKILQANVMTLPIIVNNNRITHTVKTPIQPGIIAHVSKLASGSVSNDGSIISNSITTSIPSNTMVASIQANQGNIQTIQVSQSNNQGQQGSSYTTQSAHQQMSNITTQGGIITVSQQQPQLISNQNMHQGGQTTVVPLQIAPRGGNMPIKTITVSTPNSGSLDASNIHRNLSSNTANLQATTIMPIAKIVSQQQQQNLVSAAQVGNQSTPVFIHTRINAPTISSSVTQSSQVVTVSTPSSLQSGFSTGSTTVYYEPASVSIAPSIGGVSGEQTKTTASSSMSNNESSTSSSSYTVVSGPNVRYNEKMIHSIIANSFQQQQQQQQQQQHHQQQQQQHHQQNVNNANQSLSSIVSNQSQPVRYSPLVVENQTSGAQNQSQHHQIITMAPGTIIQQTSQASHHQHHGLSVEAIAANILSSLPSSHCAIRKNETTPVKMNKKASKAAAAAVITKHDLQKHMQPMTAASSSSSPPKPIVFTRKQSECEEEWSDDGSTTVSIPNSPSPEEDDLDAMIMSNQFSNKKSNHEDELNKYLPKSASKISSSVKRDLMDIQMTPRKKLKTASERLAAATASTASTDVVDKVENAENNENAAKKRDFILKKPQVSLLTSYSQTWKPAANHFVRYSDVRARDDRKPSIMDLANQPRVLQRINGWKTYLIKAEIDEVINDEMHEMEILTSVLKRLETKESGADAEKINELIKGNVQRSKLIIDSLNDSKTQLMKIFDHKAHAADIINRCASKRNFKKR